MSNKIGLIICGLLLIACSVWADMNPYIAGQVVGVTCSGDLSNGDNEAFEADAVGDFCLTDWTESDADNIITTQSTDWSHTGDSSFKVAMSSTNERGVGYADLGSSIDRCSARFYLRTPSNLTSLSFSGATLIISAFGTGTPYGYSMMLQMNDSGVRLYNGTTTSAYIALSDSTTYRIEYEHYKNTSVTLYVYTDSNSLVDSVTLTSADTQIRYFSIGQSNPNNTIQYATYYIDNVKVSTSGGLIGEE